jgi:hypothetical protein
MSNQIIGTDKAVGLTIAERRKIARQNLDEIFLSPSAAFKQFRTLFVTKSTQAEAVALLNELCGIENAVEIVKGKIEFAQKVQGLTTFFSIASTGHYLTLILAKTDPKMVKRSYTPSQMLTAVYRFSKWAESVKGREELLNIAREVKRQEAELKAEITA